MYARRSPSLTAHAFTNSRAPTRSRAGQAARGLGTNDLSGYRGAQYCWRPCLRTIQAAAWQDRKLLLTYRKANGEIIERIVDPLGLVAKAGIWYLVGAMNGKMRVLRISRVQAATITEGPCQRPEGFDLATFWTEWSAEFRASWPQYPVTVR